MATEILTDIIATLVEVIGVFGEPQSSRRQLDAYRQLKGLPPQQQYAALFYLQQTHGVEEVAKWIAAMESRLERSESQRVRTFEEVLS